MFWWDPHQIRRRYHIESQTAIIEALIDLAEWFYRLVIYTDPCSSGPSLTFRYKSDYMRPRSCHVRSERCRIRLSHCRLRYTGSLDACTQQPRCAYSLRELCIRRSWKDWTEWRTQMERSIWMYCTRDDVATYKMTISCSVHVSTMVYERNRGLTFTW